MGAAYDLMCENEGLESTIRSLRTKNSNLRKEIVALAKEFHVYIEDSNKDFGYLPLKQKLDKIINKYEKKKKTK